MLCPVDMAGPQSRLMQQVDQFQSTQVGDRSIGIRKTIHDVCTVVQDMLKEVEAQEPRFISSLTEINGRYDGLRVISPTEYEVVLYLNQMGEFNFVDDGSMPGCAVLKLSDGRKRSMSLWVEFITASGYLSARKIRCRFQTLVAQACDKSSYRVRPAKQGERGVAEQAELDLDGGGRLDHQLARGREPVVGGGREEEGPLHPQDHQGQAP